MAEAGDDAAVGQRRVTKRHVLRSATGVQLCAISGERLRLGCHRSIERGSFSQIFEHL